MAAYFALPEANHHLLEGLILPKNNSQNLFFVLINSRYYHPRNQKRYTITKKVISRSKVGFLEFRPTAKNKFLQFFEVLSWGSYLSFYLAQLNHKDPSPIPWVDYFKHELQK